MITDRDINRLALEAIQLVHDIPGKDCDLYWSLMIKNAIYKAVGMATGEYIQVQTDSTAGVQP